MRRKSTISLFLLALHLIVLHSGYAFCGAAEDGKTVWKIATLAPKGIGWSAYIEENVYPRLAKATEDQMVFKTYWGGVMGDDADYLKKMRIGQLDGAGFSGKGCVLAVPEFAVLELPFLFESWEEVTLVRNAMRPVFDQCAHDHGFAALQWVDQDFDQIYTVHHPPDSVEHLRKSRFGVWQGPVEAAIFKTLDVNGVPVGAQEISSTLRTGGVDAMIAPAIWVVGAQLYTVFKYVNPVKIRYSPALVLAARSSFEAIPKKHQENLIAMRGEIEDDFCARVRADNARFVAAMVKYGLERSEMSPENLEEMKRRCQAAYGMLEGGHYPPELLEQIQDLLAAHREERSG